MANPVSPAIHRLFLTSTIALDLAAIAIGFLLPALIRFNPDQLLLAAARASGVALMILGALLWVTLLSARGAYAPRIIVSGWGQVMRVATAMGLAWVLTQFFAFLLKAQVPFQSRLFFGLSFPSVLAALLLARFAIARPVALRVYSRVARGGILVLGDTERAERLAKAIEEGDARGRDVIHLPLAATTPGEAARAVEMNGIGEVFIEPDGRGLEEVFETAFACLDARSEVKLVSSRFRVLSGRLSGNGFDGIPVMRFRRFDLNGPEVAIKRLVDVAGAALGLIVLSPVLLAIAIAVKATSPGPVLFRQERVGRHGRRFTMLKFRTMIAGNDSAKHREYLKSFIRDGAAAAVAPDGTKIYKIASDPRVTLLGAWLRALSLDELPQLWNVLVGDMSLVGPRPCLPYEWEMYRPWQRRRLDVTPGCTGLWQVTARSLVTFDEMVILDLHYAHHGTIGRDFWLLARTVPAMIRGRGGY